jgi:hypothetical protein
MASKRSSALRLRATGTPKTAHIEKHVFFTRQSTQGSLRAPRNHHGPPRSPWWWRGARVDPEK